VASPSDSSSDGPPRALLIAAVAVAVAAVAAVLVIAAVRQLPEQLRPVPIVSVPAPQADSPQCSALMAALPNELGDYRRAEAAQPAPKSAAAWQTSPDADPVILRCGLERPAEFVVGSPLQVVDGVSWFEVTDADRSTWFAVDRPVYIALTLPTGSGPTPIQQISDATANAMPARPPDPAPAR
jgi:uncharacterized protein DUF3515